MNMGCYFKKCLAGKVGNFSQKSNFLLEIKIDGLSPKTLYKKKHI